MLFPTISTYLEGHYVDLGALQNVSVVVRETFIVWLDHRESRKSMNNLCHI